MSIVQENRPTLQCVQLHLFDAVSARYKRTDEIDDLIDRLGVALYRHNFGAEGRDEESEEEDEESEEEDEESEGEDEELNAFLAVPAVPALPVEPERLRCFAVPDMPDYFHTVDHQFLIQQLNVDTIIVYGVSVDLDNPLNSLRPLTEKEQEFARHFGMTFSGELLPPSVKSTSKR
jgi:hypothetical protein